MDSLRQRNVKGEKTSDGEKPSKPTVPENGRVEEDFNYEKGKKSKNLFGLYFALIMGFVSLGYCLNAIVANHNQMNKNVEFNKRALARQKLRKAPLIFIGGFPRSGNTLMQAILNAHPDVHCAADDWIVPRVLTFSKKIYNRTDYLIRLSNGGIGEQVLDNAFAAYMTEVLLSQKKPGKRQCNRNPLMLKTGKYVAKLFPRSKFVFMIRDGRACVNSVIKRNDSMVHALLKMSPTNFTANFECWQKNVQDMYQHCLNIGRTRCIPVWYEALVMNPRAVIKAVLDFLGLEWHDNVMKHYKFVDDNSTNFISYLDEVKKPISKKSLYSFVGNIPDHIEAKLHTIAPVLAKFGYEATAGGDYHRNLRLPGEYRTLYLSPPS